MPIKSPDPRSGAQALHSDVDRRDFICNPIGLGLDSPPLKGLLPKPFGAEISVVGQGIWTADDNVLSEKLRPGPLLKKTRP